MTTSDEMMRAARTLAGPCTSVRPGENVLIVAEFEMPSVAQALAAATRERGGEPVIVFIEQRPSGPRDVPRPVAEAMKGADVIFGAVKVPITRTAAVMEAAAAGARAVSLTAPTEEAMISEGLDADFQQVDITSKAVGDRIRNARLGRVTSEQGTDLTFRIEGRPVTVMSCVVGPGEVSPVPTAQVNFSPIEWTANGVIVADTSIPALGIGLLKKPIRFTVSGGFIVKIEGGDPGQVDVLREAWEEQADPNVYNVAEVGLGMNPKCRFKGLLLEDNGVMGSIHIGTGSNIPLGGAVRAKSHYDLIMRAPTLELDGAVLIQDGQLRL